MSEDKKKMIEQKKRVIDNLTSVHLYCYENPTFSHQDVLKAQIVEALSVITQNLNEIRLSLKKIENK